MSIPNLNSINLILPKAEDSEIEVLGSIIQEGSLIRKTNLSSSDFSSEKHRAIFSTMQDMERKGSPIDIATLFDEIKKTGKDEITGGSSYLTYLPELTLSTANFEYHVRQVKEASIQREIVKGLYSTLEVATNGGSLGSVKAGIAKLMQFTEAHIERPEMKEEAYYGLAGEMVKIISPHSEADPLALLANFLTAFGNVIGNNAHFKVEADTHPMRIFCVLVGDTSKGRKGTSWGYIKNVFHTIDPEWVESVQTGLSSGEGLIWAVRDEIRKRQPVKKEGKVVDYEEIIVDKGVYDKRLLIMESEFSTTLRVMEREGNTLSPVIRCGWDTGNLQTLTKNSPAKATGAHISIIGHITREELLRHLTTTEMANGFGNRFLWLCVKRSKSLPFGGGFNKENLEPFIKKLKTAIEYAKNVDEVTWAEETKLLWEAVYPKLSEGKPGLIEAVTARAEAYVTRLACIYCLLDLSTKIRPEHLRAALAFWEYAETSVKHIFRDSYGIPLINELRGALRERPMTRTEINNLLGRNYPSEQIDTMLSEIGAKKDSVSTRGRPKEIWTV